MAKITIVPDATILGASPVTLEWGTDSEYTRTAGAIGLRIGGVYNTNIGVEFDVLPDGGLQLKSVGAGDGNPFAIIICMSGPATEDQKRIIARAYLGLERPYGLDPDYSVLPRVFGGLSPADIDRLYGDQ